MRLTALIVAFLVALASVAVVWAPATTRTRVRFAWQRGHGEVPEWLDDWAGDPVPIWYDMAPHVRMLLDPWDMGPRMILESGEYEKLSMGYLQEALRAAAPGGGTVTGPTGLGTFIDVGANFGVYSLVMAAAGASRVVAVEPNPESVARLRGNVEASGVRVEIVPVAAGDATGRMRLWVAPRDNTGQTSLSRENARGTSESYDVPVRTLDSIAAGGRVDAIKIDVEGAEMMVLRGAQGTLTRWHPMLLVEIVERQLVTMGTSGEELRWYLRSLGYREGRRDGDNYEFVWGGCTGTPPGLDYECRTAQWGAR